MFHLKETHSVKNDDALKILVSSAQTLKMAASMASGSSNELATSHHLTANESKKLSNGKSSINI